MKTAILLFIICSFFSCRSTKEFTKYLEEKDYHGYWYQVAEKTVDTTFSYNLIDLEKAIFYPYYYILPDSLSGKKITDGEIEFYSLINENGIVTDIDLRYAALFKSKRLIYIYSKKKNFDSDSSYTRKLSNFVLSKVAQITPKKRNDSYGLHPTFCVFKIYNE